MNEILQDRIDTYLQGRMTDEEKRQFEQDVARQPWLREQLELTRQVSKAISSRQQKLEQLQALQARYAREHQTSSVPPEVQPAVPDVRVQRKPLRWIWTSGVAAALFVGFLVMDRLTSGQDPYGIESTEVEPVRGDSEIFDPTAPLGADTLTTDTFRLP